MKHEFRAVVVGVDKIRQEIKQETSTVVVCKDLIREEFKDELVVVR